MAAWQTARRFHSAVAVVTEDDVETAVQAAEDSWADALKARKLAETKALEAEEAADAAGVSSEAVSNELNAASKFSLSMLGDAKGAMDSSLDATALLSEAVEAAEEADRLEEIAEAALAASELALAQHLEDFPDSDDED